MWQLVPAWSSAIFSFTDGVIQMGMRIFALFSIGAPRFSLYIGLFGHSGTPVLLPPPKQVHLKPDYGNPAKPCAAGIAGRCDP